ncbi:alsin-like isoform X4 [Chelmon rostratus]|uniref:alsin-like isoform X4 n=1 Tax=Chelmon rostratus TaxID=109905 RepID=UPI001BEA4EF0|nr:alsin-like isoform X4 [Chelmon rostratus]
MECREERPADEQAPTPLERGLLHIWQSVGSCAQVCPERVFLSRPVLQTALGEHHGLLLTQGGLVYSFGELLWRDLSVPVSDPVLEASLLGRMVVRVAAGGFHCGALSEQGNVYVWGENTAGQCGLTERGIAANITVSEPCPLTVVDSDVVPPAAVRVVNLAFGREHSLALSAQNELWAWGSGCQLGLVTNTFPVWRPQKVEHLSGRHVIQVACGAYHSLALVRSLPPQNYNTQKPSEKRERGQSPHYTVTEKEEPFVVDGGHYCPLGVELTEVMTSETSPRRRGPRRRLQPGGRSAGSSPASVASEDGKSNTKQYSIMKNLPAGTKLEPDDPLTQTDGSPKSQPLPGCRSNKKSAFPDEMELQSLLQKLSCHSLEMHHTSGPGDTDSLSSYTSDDSCVSSTPSTDLLTSSYKEDFPIKSQSNNNSGLAVPYSSSPVCLEDVRLCLEAEEQALKGKKSSSLTNINQRGNTAANRRRSLPGTPTRGSPRRRRPCACKPSSAGRTQAAAPEEADDGLPSLDTEVWSWGRGSEGQLGHGDQLARLQPLCIKPLTGEEVIQVAAGSHHSLALTAHCQVYSWGSNMCGQLGHVNSPVTVPQQTKLSDGLRVWDVSAGQSHSLLLADGDCVQPVLLYCGQRQEPMSAQSERSNPNQRSCQRSPNRAESYTVRPTLLPFCMEMGYASSVCSGGQNCTVLVDQNVMGFISAIHEMASRERQFYCWLNSVRKLLLTPLRNRESSCPSLGEPCTHLFFSLCESFVRLSTLIGRHSTSLTYFQHDVQGRDVTSLPLLMQTEHFLDSYKEYCSSVGNFQVMGGFQSLRKLSLECLDSQQTVLAQLCVSDQSVGGDADLVSLLYRPLQQLHQYSRVLLKLAACYDVLTAEYQSLHQGFSQYESLSLSLLRRKKEAETTLLFWKTHSGKTTQEVLRLPQRRVVCESSNRSLTLQNAGRFSNHWFMLFNDVLVHTQGAIPSQSLFSTHHVYPLTCLWVKPVTEDSSSLYAIKITCPEESFTVVASTPQEKNKWLRSINQAVDQVLGGGGQGSSPGVMGMSRTASYTFTGEGRFKDAKYTGGWLAGRVHGRGTMKWPDGQMYSGNFKNGLEDGYGECIIPNKTLNKPDIYQGHWREGKIHGFGKYKYASGEVYEGCFSDGQRHGYGMLSSGKMAKKSSSVFIGHWVHDKKTGYGVYDDITRGEKYMGVWLDEQRHGSAVVVTQHGVYYEGTFRDNKMSGPGLLVSDDDTALHGEFSDDWTVNGKGVLSLANGDCLEGQFSGEWTAGLKVVGTYTKPVVDEPESKDRSSVLRLGQYVVPAGQRWVCVFDECWSRLGCDAPGRGERAAAWENIAVTITTARRHSPDLSKSQTKVLECLEFIPQHGEPVTTANYDNIRRYLIKACETPLHPLGWLVETLVTVYRMTYVGVGSNCRLLRQAVQEVQAYLTHFYCIVRFLFPGLPDDGGIIPDPPASPAGRHNSDTAEQAVMVVSCSSLLLPLLLPRLYPPLFTLYCLQEEREEAQYWERILRINKQPDQSLLNFLGVQEKFWPVWMSILGERKQIVSTSKDACFVSAVETLQQISTTFTPSDKLLVIQKTFEELTQEVKPLLHGDFLWCMDDLLPLFLYVVFRARIRNLGAEVNLIEDLMDPNVQHGELGMMFTTLKACYIQIQREPTT